MITNELIQKRLAEAIKTCGLNQSEIARRLGITHQQISCYVLGQKMPPVETLANLCKIIDANTDYILCQDYSDK